MAVPARRDHFDWRLKAEAEKSRGEGTRFFGPQQDGRASAVKTKRRAVCSRPRHGCLRDQISPLRYAPAEMTGMEGCAPVEMTGMEGYAPVEMTGMEGYAPVEMTTTQGCAPAEMTGMEGCAPVEMTGAAGCA